MLKITPQQFKILTATANGINTTTDLAKVFGVKPPTISGQLKKLKDVGLVCVVLREGKHTYYTTTAKGFDFPCPTCGRRREL